MRTAAGLVLVIGAMAAGLAAQDKLPPPAQRTFASPTTFAPDLNERVTTSELRDVVPRYTADRALLLRFHTVTASAARVAAQRAFADGWLKAMAAMEFDRLSQDGKVDYILLRQRIEADRRAVDTDARALDATATLLPFGAEMAALQEARQRLAFVKSDAAAAAVEGLTTRVKTTVDEVSAGRITLTPANAALAVGQLESLRGSLDEWFQFYNGYDPAFTGRVTPLYTALTEAVGQYVEVLRGKSGGLAPPAGGGRGGRGGGRGGAGGGGAGTGAATGAGAAQPLVLGEPIVGTPVGRAALIELLQREMIVYTPEQLIEIGNREYAWTEAEMKKASRELGFGDDWRKALERVKEAYVPPGGQPELVRNLALQAEAFLGKHDLITIPPIVRDTWRMTMMSPQTMRTAPFFLGGESIIVSYPVIGMGEDLATMIMKGNGPHLSHATVFHELIPGHNLQGYMAQRYNAHRSIFSTPFYGEGWSLYWEMLMWDRGFHATPEDRIGALFWRMHRAARIVFTMNYQMGRWTPAQCVEFLVSNGHERYTAEGEVRGHVQNSPPLYQISYLMGALQLWSVYKDVVVDRKVMTTKQFNDRVVRTGSMPIEMVRALVANQPLTRDYRAQWKFYGEVPEAK